MIRTIALLCLVGFASALWNPFGNKPWKAGLSCLLGTFKDLPRDCSAAKEKGWSMVATRPARPYSSGFDELDLWVNPKDIPVGILTDENCQTGGLQIAIPRDELTPYYDMTEQGLTPWTYTNSDGDTVEYWTINMYFVPEDKETRIASYDTNEVLRAPDVVVEGNNGELTKISTNLTSLEKIWTKQACLPLMGLHYYYNMTTTLTCDKPFFPWFPLWDEKTTQLIGMGFMAMGKVNSKAFENPGRLAVKIIVPTSPECLLDMVDEQGVYTLHVYFNDNPKLIFC